MNKLFIFFFFIFCTFSFAQKAMVGQVLDFDTNVPVAFAKIRYENTAIESDWEGKFSIEITDVKKPILVTYKGYIDKTYFLTKNSPFIIIKLISSEKRKGKEIYSDQKVNNIIKKVVENKPKTQPEKALGTYSYKNYEHILVSANPDLIVAKIDTIYNTNFFGKKTFKIDSTNYKFKKFIENQHLYQTEKVNLIQHNSKGTKETIIAARMAGFKEPLYEYLGLNLVSYSLYDSSLKILEIPINNPLSNYGRKLFSFKLIDSLTIKNRKVYRIYFQPKNLNSNKLRGLLFIDAENFGIAKAFFRIYGMVNINATYTFDYLKDYNLWFPEKRNFMVVKGNNADDIKILGGTVHFNSSLDTELKNDASDHVYLKLESTPFDIQINKPEQFRNPKIKIEVPEKSLSKPNSFWSSVRKDTLDQRKINTYSAIDSLSESSNLEKKIFLGKKIYNGYFPVGKIDVDLRSIVKYNNYEGFRVGFGGVTNRKFSEQYKLAAYGAYGLKDKGFKFGITPSYLLDKETSTWASASYSDDLNEIGIIEFASQAKRFKVYDPRPINISTFYKDKTFSTFIESNYFAKTTTYFGLNRSQIEPLFDYVFKVGDSDFTKYNISTAQFSIQWNPFSEYMQTANGRLEIQKLFPKFSFQITQTIPSILGNDFEFSKFDFKIQHDIPFLSGHVSSFIFQAGLGFGDIPLTHLYSISPNNLNKDALLKRITFGGKNNFETMYFNEFFSNRYFSLQARHTFNKTRIAQGIKPVIAVVTRLAFGTVDHPNQHQNFEFKTLEKGFFESGVELNKIIYGFGLTGFFRYGPNMLPKFEDNLSLKINFNLDLGF